MPVGSFETSNNANKTIIDALGSQFVVRCTSVSDPDAACTDYAKRQVVPSKILRDPASPPAMTATQLAPFKAAAQSASPSTYYTSCPSSLTATNRRSPSWAPNCVL